MHKFFWKLNAASDFRVVVFSTGETVSVAIDGFTCGEIAAHQLAPDTSKLPIN